MSCGRPHETPCSQVVASLSTYIDGEVRAEEHRLIAVHLTECPPCDHQRREVRRVQALVVRASASSTTPEGLHASIRAMIVFRYLCPASRRRSGVGSGQPYIQRAHMRSHGTHDQRGNGRVGAQRRGFARGQRGRRGSPSRPRVDEDGDSCARGARWPGRGDLRRGGNGRPRGRRPGVLALGRHR